MTIEKIDNENESYDIDDYDIDELMNDELESDLLEATVVIQDVLITIDDKLHTCVNFLLVTDVLLALIIGIICASIFSRFFKY